jgi:hypothetical protein
MKKSQLIKEAFVASLLVICIDLMISFFPWKSDFIKPIKQGLDDFDIYDLRYSGADPTAGKKDTNITLLQIAESRSEIAAQIAKVMSLNPKIIGIDAIFNDPQNEEKDSLLIQALKMSKTVVVASRYFGRSDSGREYIKRSFFSDKIPGLMDGFFNLAEGPVSTQRHFAPFVPINSEIYPSMTTRMLEALSPEAYNKLISRHRSIESIYYSGNLSDFNVVTYNQFKNLDGHAGTDDYFRNKIVFIGFFIERPPYVLEDFHFTPMNDKHGGKSFPDMYGVVIQANILEMLLNGHFINEMPLWLVYSITFILLLFINVFYIWTLNRYHEHKHLMLFIFQLFLVSLFVYAALLIFDWFDYKIDLMPLIIGAGLSLEIFWLYEILAKRMKKLFQYETFVH